MSLSLWTLNSEITRSRLPQVMALMPVAGYAIIWNSKVHLFEYAHLGEKILFSPIERLHLVYWGGVLIAAGWILFRSRCPKEIRLYTSSTSLMANIVSTGNISAINDIKKTVGVEFERKFGTQKEFKLTKDRDSAKLGNYDAYLIFEGLSQARNNKTMRDIIYSDGRERNLGTMISYFYEYLSNTRQPSAVITLALYTIGALAFIAPSFEVFLMVLRAIVSAPI